MSGRRSLVLVLLPLVVGLAAACQPPGEIQLIIDHNDIDGGRVFYEDGQPADEPFETSGDGDGDMAGDGDGDGDCTYTWFEESFVVDDPQPGNCLPVLQRYDEIQNLWVGLSSCVDNTWRLYLSEERFGVYYPAVDTAGHGQDHCELFDANFWIANEDDINSGNCGSCEANGVIGVAGSRAFQRGYLGEQFTFNPSAAASLYATELYCGVDPWQCVEPDIIDG